MKSLIFAISVLLITIPFRINAGQANDNTIDQIVKAMRQGNASELSTYFNPMISLKIPGSDNSYSKVQATRIIKEFFDQKTVRTFTLIRSGEDRGALLYLIGTLETAKGNYRCCIILKQINQQQLVQELKIEETQ